MEGPEACGVSLVAIAYIYQDEIPSLYHTLSQRQTPHLALSCAMANTATTLYDAFLNVRNQLSVPLTDGEIQLDSGTLERPIQSTIDPGRSAPTIVVSAGEYSWCEFCA